MATATINPGQPAVTQIVVPEQPETVTLTMTREEATAIMTLTSHVHNADTDLRTIDVHNALARAGIRYFGHYHLTQRPSTLFSDDGFTLAIKRGKN